MKTRDIINAPELHAQAEAVLAAAPAALRAVPEVGVWLRRALEQHESVKRARRRKDDPAWAQSKFAEGRPLFRFFPGQFDDWDIDSALRPLGEVAEVAAAGGQHVRDAKALLRSLAHSLPDLYEAESAARRLLERIARSRLLAERMIQRRDPLSLESGGLIGTRCATIGEIIRLGREARNCLDARDAYWAEFADGKVDVWSVHGGGRLVAVLKVMRSQNRVVEAHGPGNAVVSIFDAPAVARFCAEAGFGIGTDCAGLLPGYAAAPLIPPTVVEIETELACYCEWPEAVRIDFWGKRRQRRANRRGGGRMLALAFDPHRPAGAVDEDEDEPSLRIMLFGAKKVRRIVRAIGLSRTAPSLVQHRLLVLAA